MRVICKGHNHWVANIDAIALVERIDNEVTIHFVSGLSSTWTSETIEDAQNMVWKIQNFLNGDESTLPKKLELP